MVTGFNLIRRPAAVAVGAITAFSLAACSSADSVDSSSGPTGSATEPINKTVTIGMNSGLVPAFEGYASAFEEANPGWTVNVSAVPDAQPDYISQLVAQNLSGTTPDIIFDYDTLNQTLVGNKILFDMKPWLDQGKDGLSGDGFLSNFLGQYVVGDSITALPVSADSGMLFYNIDVFKKYGIDELPTPDWTMDDMYRVAKEITDKSGGDAYGLVTPIGNGDAFFLFYPVLKAYGSNLYDPESKKFVFANEAGIKAWTELLKPYVDGFGSPYGANGVDLFNSGQAAMIETARPLVGQFRESLTGDWNVERQPTVNGNSTTGGGSYSLAISDASKNKEGAWKFLSWFYSTDGGMKAAEPNGVVPATADGIANGSWKNPSNPIPANLTEVTEYAVQNAVLPDAIPDAVQPKVAPALTKALQEVVIDGKSIQDAYTAAQDELNGLLQP